MTVKQLFMKYKDKEDTLLKHYVKLFPIFENYEIETMKRNKVKKATQTFLTLAEKRFQELLNIEVNSNKNEQVIFVVKQKEYFLNGGYYFDTFSCNKEEIKEKANKDFTLWTNNESRIEHYAYDFDKPEDILGHEIFYTCKDINAACTVFHELIAFGLTQEHSENRKEEIITSLKEGIKEAKEGKGIPADVVFKELEEEILNSASEKEKIQIIKEKEEQKKNETRDRTYSTVTMMHNHYLCISVIQDYYLKMIESGEIIINNPEEIKTATY